MSGKNKGVFIGAPLLNDTGGVCVMPVLQENGIVEYENGGFDDIQMLLDFVDGGCLTALPSENVNAVKVALNPWSSDGKYKRRGPGGSVGDTGRILLDFPSLPRPQYDSAILDPNMDIADPINPLDVDKMDEWCSRYVDGM